MNFTGSGQTNVNTPSNPTFTNLTVSFPTASIVNGASEQIILSGATNGTIALNADPNITNLTLGGIIYTVVGSTANGIRTLSFTRNSGSFVTANIESLLDAMQ